VHVEASSPWDGGVGDPLETRYSTTCYRTKFRRSRSNRFGISTGTLWLRPSRGEDVADHENILLPRLSYRAKFGSFKPLERNYGDLPENFDPITSRLSRSLKVIGTRELFTPPYWGWYTPLLTLTHTPKLCSPIGVCVLF